MLHVNHLWRWKGKQQFWEVKLCEINFMTDSTKTRSLDWGSERVRLKLFSFFVPVAEILYLFSWDLLEN